MMRVPAARRDGTALARIPLEGPFPETDFEPDLNAGGHCAAGTFQKIPIRERTT